MGVVMTKQTASAPRGRAIDGFISCGIRSAKSIEQAQPLGYYFATHAVVALENNTVNNSRKRN